MILKIVSYPNIGLLTKTNNVQNIDANILSLLDDMTETMYTGRGIGLAANQVASPLRMCVIDISEEKNSLLKLINPQIVSESGEVFSEEGCLSFSGVSVIVARPANVVVSAIDPIGKELILEASGLLATCLSHEIDHLDGRTFLDKLGKMSRQIALSKLAKAQKFIVNVRKGKAIETI